MLYTPPHGHSYQWLGQSRGFWLPHYSYLECKQTWAVWALWVEFSGLPVFAQLKVTPLCSYVLHCLPFLSHCPVYGGAKDTRLSPILYVFLREPKSSFQPKSEVCHVVLPYETATCHGHSSWYLGLQEQMLSKPSWEHLQMIYPEVCFHGDSYLLQFRMKDSHPLVQIS